MSHLIIERYVYDALNARANLAGNGDEPGRRLARGIIRDIEVYCADHMDDVFAAHLRLRTRTDAEGMEMLAYVETLLASFAEAGDAARAALIKANRG